MKNIIVSHVIQKFTQKINNILSGKLKTPTQENDSIEKSAFEFRKKRKEISKFVPRGEMCKYKENVNSKNDITKVKKIKKE